MSPYRTPWNPTQVVLAIDIDSIEGAAMAIRHGAIIGAFDVDDSARGTRLGDDVVERFSRRVIVERFSRRVIHSPAMRIAQTEVGR